VVSLKKTNQLKTLLQPLLDSINQPLFFEIEATRFILFILIF